eukprot:6173115-Pleurochrysis_carterae.AAC.1
MHNHPTKRRRSATSAGASSSAANAFLPTPSVLTPTVPTAAAAPSFPTTVLAAPPQLQPPPPAQSPAWLLEWPANAARRRRLNLAERTGFQRLLGLPCACVACVAPSCTPSLSLNLPQPHTVKLLA